MPTDFAIMTKSFEKRESSYGTTLLRTSSLEIMKSEITET